MRHGDKQNNLGRKKEHREALLRNLAIELIKHKRIVTTHAKAKALRQFVEPLITKTKKTASSEVIMHNHRVVFSYLGNKYAIKELFTNIAPKVAARPGGYTRIIKLGTRMGDNAELAMIELVDFNEVYNAAAAKTETGKKTRRSRRGSGSNKPAAAETPITEATVPAETEAVPAPQDEVTTVEEAPVQDEPVVDSPVDNTPLENPEAGAEQHKEEK